MIEHIVLIENVMLSSCLVLIFSMAFGYHRQIEAKAYWDTWEDWACYMSACISGLVFFVSTQLWIWA